MNRFLASLLLITAATTTFAGTNGGFAGAFARIGAGARAKAMGNAYTAVAEGPSAVYFNPGAIPFHREREFSATLTDLALDRRLDYLAFTTPVHPKPSSEQKPVNAGIGLAWLHAGVADIDARDFDGRPLDRIDQSSNLFALAFGIQFHEKFGAGLAAKVIYETFGKIGGDNDRSINGDGVGLDVGAFGRPIEHLTVGLLIKDIASKTTWNTNEYWSQGSSKADEWPMQYRFGAAYSRMGLTGAMDVESSEEGETRLHLGTEAATRIDDKYSFAGRVGYDDGAVTFGIGVGLATWKVRSTVDFTYALEDIAPDDAFVVSWNVAF
ncbi:hypothetical protein KKH27_12920 [bacterium]|nr:hypothetical protein [bacterium]MBU1983648.1 hypothetical protein [bacterium]